MRYAYPDTSPSTLFSRIKAVAQAVEDAGFDALWVPDQVVHNRIGLHQSTPEFDAFTLLGALATQTTRVALGSFVSPVTLKNPAILAKIVTTLDVISNGRAIHGIDAAWDDDERAAFDVGDPDSGERFDQLEDSIRVARAMFTEQEPSVVGNGVSIRNAFNSPRPIQASIPIVVSGTGERLALRIAAQYANACIVFGNPQIVRHNFDVLAAHCADVGRDANDVERICAVPSPGFASELLDIVAARLEAGAQGVIVRAEVVPDADVIHSWGIALVKAFGKSAT